jgi:hypothetical protein
MDQKIQKSWEDFLNPDIVRPYLIVTSVYIFAFQILKDSIIGRIRDFFCNGFNEKGEIIDSKYQTEVLGLNKSPVYASLEWLKSMKAIEQNDVEIFERIKKCRNTLAHDFSHLTTGTGLPQDFDNNFRNMVSLLRKIEVWWIMNVELAVNPDYDGQEIDESGIIPGPLMSLQILCDVALGSDEQSKFYLEQFKQTNEQLKGQRRDGK